CLRRHADCSIHPRVPPEGAMSRLLALRTAAAALALLPAAALAQSTAAVVVADDGGLEVPAVRAIRAVTAGELRKRGVVVSEDANAAMRTVTATEARPFQKKPGERFWVVGLPLLLAHGDGGRNTPSGFSLSYFYEAEAFRVGASAVAASRDGSGLGWFGLDAAWLPLDREISPYLG